MVTQVASCKLQFRLLDLYISIELDSLICHHDVASGCTGAWATGMDYFLQTVTEALVRMQQCTQGAGMRRITHAAQAQVFSNGGLRCHLPFSQSPSLLCTLLSSKFFSYL